MSSLDFLSPSKSQQVAGDRETTQGDLTVALALALQLQDACLGRQGPWKQGKKQKLLERDLNLHPDARLGKHRVTTYLSHKHPWCGSRVCLYL